MSADAKAFGTLVRQRRKALGWSGEYLAGKALGNLERKGMISQIENGKIPNITRETVKRVAEALSIDVEEIPASLRWSEAVEVGKDTNTVVHELQAASERSQAIDEQVLANTDKLVELLSTPAEDFMIKEGMLIALARRYAEGSPNDFNAAYAGLEQALEVAAQDRERSKLLSNTDDAETDVVARVDALNDEGNIDTAATLLLEEEAHAQAGLLRLYDKGIAQAILTYDVDAAVSYELKKLSLEVEITSSDDSYAYLRGVYIDWFTKGDEKGLNFYASVTVALMRHMVLRFGDEQEKKGACLNNLGNALFILGEREIGTARLEEAVTAYRSALEESTRDRVPLGWAATQMNLGNALRVVGARKSGPAHLEEAVTAYRSALEEFTRDRVPLDWALTQMNLGIALCTLGERESGTARLEEAVTACRSALEERTRDRVPLDWALTQMNLGIALCTLGERESGTARLEEAVTAYRSALEERTRDRFPLHWAMTQHNLGTALSVLGQRESGIARLEEAVTAYRSALEERTRDRVPLYWAMTQMNLGITLCTLGERESGTARLEEAATAYRNVLEERNRDRVPLDWANTVGYEAIALITLADRTRDVRLARRAIDQLIEAETVLSEGGDEIRARKFADKTPEAEALLTRLHATGVKD